MAWRRPGDKPFSEPMLVSFNDACMRHSASMTVNTRGHRSAAGFYPAACVGTVAIDKELISVDLKFIYSQVNSLGKHN